MVVHSFSQFESFETKIKYFRAQNFQNYVFEGAHVTSGSSWLPCILLNKMNQAKVNNYGENFFLHAHMNVSI